MADKVMADKVFLIHFELRSSLNERVLERSSSSSFLLSPKPFLRV